MGVTPPLRRSVLGTGASQGGADPESSTDEAALVCADIFEASSVTTTLDPPRDERSGLDEADEPCVDKAASKSKPPMPESPLFFAFFSFFGSGALRAGSGAFRLGAFRAVSALAMFSLPSRTRACEVAAPFTRAEETT